MTKTIFVVLGYRIEANNERNTWVACAESSRENAEKAIKILQATMPPDRTFFYMATSFHEEKSK